MLLLTLFLCCSALQSVRLALKRDMRSAVSKRYFVNVHFGSPAVEHKLMLTSFPTNGSGVFHCLGALSKTYDADNENDIVRFTEHGMASSKRTVLRASVWHHCDARTDSEAAAVRAAVLRTCASDECDGLLNLRTESPIWRAFTAFTLTRNTLEMHARPPAASSHGTPALCVAHESDVPSYCTFLASVDGKPVTVSLVADAVTVTLPSWLADKRQLTIDIPGSDSVELNLDEIDAALRTFEAKSLFTTDEEDDDDDSGRTAALGDRELASLSTRNSIGSNAPDDRIIVGTGVLMHYSVRKLLVPLEAVSFALLAVREHLTALEAMLQLGFFFHLMQLVMHSSMLNGMQVAGTAPPSAVLWIEVMSFVVTTAAFVYSLYAIINTTDSAALGSDLVVFVALQVAVNAVVLLVLSLLALGRRARQHHWWLVRSACSEQIVAVALLTLSLVVRISTDGRTVMAVLMTMILIGNAARNVYQALNLFMPVTSTAWMSGGFRITFSLLFLAFNFGYPLVQLSYSVLFVVTGLVIVVVALVLVSIGAGMHVADADRENERFMATKQPLESASRGFFYDYASYHSFNPLHHF